MDMQFARDLLEVRAEKVEYTGYEPQAITALSKVVLELVKESDRRNRIMPVDLVHVRPGNYDLSRSVEVRVGDLDAFIPTYYTDKPAVLKPGLYRLHNLVTLPVEDAKNFLEQPIPTTRQEAEYYEACMWMGYRGHKPYSTCGTGNVVERAYELGWEGPIIRKDKKK